ncbi:MAG: hypothetical protein ACLFUX_08535 [Spirochaetaceae bacterium]
MSIVYGPYKFILLLVLVGALLLSLPAPAEAASNSAEDRYESHFLGVSYEYYSFLDLDDDIEFFNRFSPRRAGAAFTYGFPGVRRPRVRVGAGWEPERPVYLSAGLEVPIFERFTYADGRSVGLFLIGDVVASFPREPRLTAEASIVGLLPVGPLGGLSVGAGMTHRGEALVSVGIMTGVFPMERNDND